MHIMLAGKFRCLLISLVLLNIAVIKSVHTHIYVISSVYFQLATDTAKTFLSCIRKYLFIYLFISAVKIVLQLFLANQGLSSRETNP